MTHRSLRMTNLEIVNEVQRMLGITTTNDLVTGEHSYVLVRLLNETLADISDYGEWQELHATVTVTTSASVESYHIDGGSPIHHIKQIRFGTQTAPLDAMTIEDLRILQAARSFGEPRQFAIVGVDSSSGNPTVLVSPIPSSAEDNGLLRADVFTQPVLVTVAATASSPVFPANLVIQGVYAGALLEENGGEPTREYEMALAKYERMKRESLNRFNADSAMEVQFMPENWGS